MTTYVFLSPNVGQAPRTTGTRDGAGIISGTDFFQQAMTDAVP
ncbi:hypothetical protein [Nitrospira defluvii]|nr:hypothetical protein [Nitrospira defluvii]